MVLMTGQELIEAVLEYYTLKELMEITGFPQRTIYRWREGESDPPKERRAILEKLLRERRDDITWRSIW